MTETTDAEIPEVAGAETSQAEPSAAEAPVAEAANSEPEVVQAAEPAPAEPEGAAPKAEPVAPSAVAGESQAAASTAAAKDDDARGRRKVRQGRVVSDKMHQTVVVAIDQIIRHPLYGKTLRRTRKFKAHDQNNDCGVGDTVEIMETRPISREKRWRVVRIIEKAK